MVPKTEQVAPVEEGQDGKGPHDAQNGGQFQQVLLGQVVARVQFEDQHVVHSRFPPSLNTEMGHEAVRLFHVLFLSHVESKTRGRTWTLRPMKKMNKAMSIGPR